MAYATLADLVAYTGQESGGPGDERRLQRASERVDAALRTAYYAVDANGLPTDAVVIAAFRDAVCAEVESYRASGDELGSQSFYRSGQNAAVRGAPQPIRTSAWDRLCAKAKDHLTVSGIWRHKPYPW